MQKKVKYLYLNTVVFKAKNVLVRVVTQVWHKYNFESQLRKITSRLFIYKACRRLIPNVHRTQNSSTPYSLGHAATQCVLWQYHARLWIFHIRYDIDLYLSKTIKRPCFLDSDKHGFSKSECRRAQIRTVFNYNLM